MYYILVLKRSTSGIYRAGDEKQGGGEEGPENISAAR